MYAAFSYQCMRQTRCFAHSYTPSLARLLLHASLDALLREEGVVPLVNFVYFPRKLQHKYREHVRRKNNLEVGEPVVFSTPTGRSARLTRLPQVGALTRLLTRLPLHACSYTLTLTQ